MSRTLPEPNIKSPPCSTQSACETCSLCPAPKPPPVLYTLISLISICAGVEVVGGTFAFVVLSLHMYVDMDIGAGVDWAMGVAELAGMGTVNGLSRGIAAI